MIYELTAWEGVLNVTLLLLLFAQELLSRTNGLKAPRVCRYLSIGIIPLLVLFAFIVTTKVLEAPNI